MEYWRLGDELKAAELARPRGWRVRMTADSVVQAGEDGTMLILTRKCSESIRIGDDITITIMRIEPGQVRIGIDAPRGLPVHREEVYERIQAEQQPIAPPTHEALRDIAREMKHKAHPAGHTPPSPARPSHDAHEQS